MDHTPEIERYVKNPDLLLKLIRDVIDFLKSEDDHQGETITMEAQLREISKAMEKLDKISVAVPDALRAEKPRLAAALGTQSKSMQELVRLSYELDKILKDLKINIGWDNDKTSPKKVRAKRSHSPFSIWHGAHSVDHCCSSSWHSRLSSPWVRTSHSSDSGSSLATRGFSCCW